MFVLAGLGLYKLAQSRCPDLVPRVHVMLINVAFIILLVVVGVVSATSCDQMASLLTYFHHSSYLLISLLLFLASPPSLLPTPSSLCSSITRVFPSPLFLHLLHPSIMYSSPPLLPPFIPPSIHSSIPS